MANEKITQSGVYTALVTPFTTQGAIDYNSLEKLIARQVKAHIRCITLFGTTGEGATISLDERQSILKYARQVVPSSTLLFSGCGTSNTQETILQAKIAEDMGADGLQIVTPPYSRPSQEGLFSHFKAIHDATQIKLFLYNIPGRSACNLEIDTLKRLFDLPRITGIKEASGNISSLMEVIQTAAEWNDKITVLCGDDLLALPAISLGAHGVMSVVSNLIPQTIHTFIQSALSQNIETARELHYTLKSLCNACFYETNPTPIKYILSKLNLLQNIVRLPLVPVSQATEKRLDAFLSTNQMQRTLEAEHKQNRDLHTSL